MEFLRFALLFLFFSSLAAAQNLKGLADSISMAHFKDPENKGLSIGIIANGKSGTYYYGGKYTSLVKDVDSLTLFEIGSVTKLYTAFILASLETDKKISRYDLLAKYLPKEIVRDKKWASQIRLVDLATHTSGLPEFDNTKSLRQFPHFNEDDPYGIFTNDFMLNILKDTKEVNGYGTVSYSNFGVGILGYAMAKSQGSTFEVLFDKYIIKKLALKNTYLRVREQNLVNVAIPHRKDEPMPLIHLEGLSPSGSIKTTMPDLLRFLNIHFSNTKDLLKTIDIVLANQLISSETPMALGWGMHTIDNHAAYFHTGGTYGSSSIVIIIPDKKLGVAILCNNSTEKQLTGYALGIIKQLIAQQ